MCPFGNCSSYRTGSNHEAAEKVESEFVMLEQDKQCQFKKSSELWKVCVPVEDISNIHHSKPLQWSSEACIRTHVSSALNDIAREGEIIVENLGFRTELSLFGTSRADIWIVTMFGVPIGVVEVKKPNSSGRDRSMDNTNVLGQLFDYLSHLRTYAGMRYAFGILTTYRKWRIGWLPDNCDIARSNNLSSTNERYPPSYSVAADLPIPHWPKNQAEKEFPLSQHTEHISTVTQLQRKIYVSKIYDFDDPMLPFVLLSLLRKMKSSPLTPPTFKLVPEQAYIHITSEKWQWQSVSSKLTLTVSGNAVPPTLDNAYLVLDLEGGGDGRVWLATTETGKVCVLKFSENKSLLEEEARLWKDIWGCDTVKVVTLLKQHVLVMPWVKPCSEKMLEKDEVKTAISEAVEKFAKSGYKHDDLYRRHVGLYKEESQVKAVLFDLARTSLVSDDEVSRQRAIEEMMGDLEL